MQVNIHTNIANLFVYKGWAKLPQNMGQLCPPIVKKNKKSGRLSRTRLVVVH